MTILDRCGCDELCPQSSLSACARATIPTKTKLLAQCALNALREAGRPLKSPKRSASHSHPLRHGTGHCATF